MLAELARHSFHAASTTLSAQQSVPWYAKESLFGARGLTILVTTLCLWMVDRMVLVPLKLKGRYFILHAAGNAIAVVLTWNGMVRTLLDPVHAAEGDVQIFGYCVVVAIHLYHVLAFRPLPQVEWVHHVLMIGGVGPVVFYYARGAIIDYCSFFLSGLPGGIDYVMLALVKNGISPMHLHEISPCISPSYVMLALFNNGGGNSSGGGGVVVAVVVVSRYAEGHLKSCPQLQ